MEDGIQPLFPYTRPKTKEGFFGKHEFAYEEYYDCYICPGAHILTYSTTNRSGYKEYKSCGEHCAECQCLSKCTESKDHVKLITRHVWEEYMEVVEDIRHTIGNRQIYQLRKETIERLEYSHFFMFGAKNKKKINNQRKMVLGINTQHQVCLQSDCTN